MFFLMIFTKSAKNLIIFVDFLKNTEMTIYVSSSE